MKIVVNLFGQAVTGLVFLPMKLEETQKLFFVV